MTRQSNHPEVGELINNKSITRNCLPDTSCEHTSISLLSPSYNIRYVHKYVCLLVPIPIHSTYTIGKVPSEIFIDMKINNKDNKGLKEI